MVLASRLRVVKGWSSMHVEGVIFDFDGTLMDSAPMIAEALSALRDERGGGPADIALVRKMISCGAKDLVTTVLGAWATDPVNDLAAFRKIYSAFRADRADLYPGAETAVRAFLAEGMRLGICTNKPQRLVERIVADIDMSDCFTAIVGGDSCAYMKPHAGHALEVLARMGTMHKRTVYVGDSEVDSQAAAAAELPFILVTFGYAIGTIKDIPHTATIDHFDELAAALATL